MNSIARAGLAACLLAAGLAAIAAGPAAAQKGKLPPGHPPIAGQPPFARQGGPEVKDPAAIKLAAHAAALEKKLKAHPKDAKLRSETAEAYYKAGFAYEYSKKELTPRTRYRTALKLYRKAVEFNPHHAQALKEKKQIEDIYRTMPGGIPK